MSETHLETQPIPTHGLFRDLTGSQFDRLRVLGFVGRQKTHTMWLCVCECGTHKAVRGSHLTGGKVLSCGCYRQEQTIRRFTTHGESVNKGSEEYRAFIRASERCNNPKNIRYSQYGERGIEFRFNTIREFIDSVGRRPSAKHSINRIDNNGHYETGNVEWATHKQQANNKSTNHPITINGKTLHLGQWATETNTPHSRILRRIRLGWCEPCSVLNPIGKNCGHKTATATPPTIS